EGHRNGQALANDIVHTMVAVFHRSPEIPSGEVAEITEVLVPDRLIQVVFGLEVALDFRRSRFAFLVKRPARGRVHQDEGQETNEDQQRNQEEEALENVHGARGASRAKLEA